MTQGGPNHATEMLPNYIFTQAFRLQAVGYASALSVILLLLALGLNAAFGTPFALIIFRSFFENLPREIEEAAKVDGCSKLGIYWRIVMPISWPAIAAVIIFQFMASFNEFVLALVTIDRNELKPMTLVPLMYSGQFMARPGVMFATLTLITIPVLIIYILMQRYLTRGMTAGAIKG